MAKLIFYKTLANIRKKHGLSQEEFAKSLGCTVEHIKLLESNKEQASFVFTTQLKDKFNLHDAPITESERAALMDGLYKWKLSIDYGDVSSAAEVMTELAKNTNASFSPSAQIFYTLYAASYYWEVNDMKAFEETMTAIGSRRDEFSARHQYFYHRLVGASKYKARCYNESLKAYEMARKLDKNSEWGDVGFFYSYGRCLSDMGYTVRAIRFLQMAQHLAKYSKIYHDKPNSRYDAYIDGYMAYNLSKLDETGDAFDILDRRLSLEKKKTGANEEIGFIYLSLGRVYFRKENYSKAQSNFEKAEEYLNKKGEAYKTNLYYKAFTLIASGKVPEGLDCVKIGVKISTCEQWKNLFNALKHSASLSAPKSLSYMKKTAISMLQESGQYEDAMDYYKVIGEFYDKGTDCAMAVFYYKLLQFYKEIIEKEI